MGLLLLLGSSAPGCSKRHKGVPTLRFLGDSITLLNAAAFNAHYRPNYQVAIHALGGTTTYAQRSTAAADAAKAPDIEVINLGTNDVGCKQPDCIGGGASKFDARIVNARYDKFAAAFPSSTCVVFVTLDSHDPRNPAGVAALNAHLRTFPHVADWDAVYQPGFFPTPGDPHPIGAGVTALMGVIDDAIATCGRGR